MTKSSLGVVNQSFPIITEARDDLQFGVSYGSASIGGKGQEARAKER